MSEGPTPPASEAPRRRIRALLAVLFLVGAGLVGATAVVARPHWVAWRARVERRERLDALLSEPESEARVAKLLAFADDPDVVIALVEARLRSPGRGFSFASNDRRAIELHAVAGPPHPRVVAMLETFARDESRAVEARLEAFYLLDELAVPTFKSEPEGFPAGPLLSGDSETTIPAKLAALGVRIREDVEEGEQLYRNPDFLLREKLVNETPYRALVRLAQLRECLLDGSGGTWTFVERRKFVSDESKRVDGELRVTGSIGGAISGRTFQLVVKDLGEDRFLAPADSDMSPLRLFRSLARLNGCTEPLRSADDPDTYECLRTR